MSFTAAIWLNKNLKPAATFIIKSNLFY